METKYIRIMDFCENQKIETTFIFDLNREGIIEIIKQEEIDFVDENDLPNLEMYARWHYDMGINLEGIDAMRHMLQRINDMQTELNLLRRKLSIGI